MTKNIAQTIETAQIRIAQLRQEIRTMCENIFMEVKDDFFEKYPQVKTIYFAAYTPYFNDGDPCEYSVGSVNFSPNSWKMIRGAYHDDNLDEEDYEEGEERPMHDFNSYYQKEAGYTISDEFKSDMKAFDRFLSRNEDFCLSAWGDHVFVRIHRDGIEVEKHEHD